MFTLFHIILKIPTVVKTPNSYYVFTTIDGINMPRFAISVTFLTISTEKANSANRAKTRKTRAFQERKINMISILFVCYGSILKCPEKACRINDFKAIKGAYYTTTTPF